MPLSLYRRPNSPYWWIRGTVRRQRIYESTGTGERDLAEEYRAAREAELYRAAIHGTRAPVTFAAAALSYLQTQARSAGTRGRLTRLLPKIGPLLTCQQLDQAMIDKLALELLRGKRLPRAEGEEDKPPQYAPPSPATQLREVVTPIRAVLQHAARRGWCPEPKFETIGTAPSRTIWLTPAEAERILTKSAKHLRPLLTWLFCTGCRLGEALALDWQDVDLAHARATVYQSKPGRDRIVELPPRAIASLANLPHREGIVFRRDDGKAYAEKKKQGGGQIKRGWAGALERAKIMKAATPHTCRHTWASWHYAVHRDLLKLKEEGAWRSVALVERYAHLAPPGIAAAAMAFWGANLVHKASEISASA